MSYLYLFLAVVLGYILARQVKGTNRRLMPIFLAFSGAFLLAITLFELLPEVFKNPSKKIGVYILGGILLQLFLEFFSKGAEHGHVHIDAKKRLFPWLLLISLSIHALLEGFPIQENNHVLIGVVVHKIPIALILSLFFIKANYSKMSTLLFLFLFALMTPLGNWLSLHTVFLSHYTTEINALAIGVFLHVSTTILFESSKNHVFNLSKMLAVLIAVVLAYFL
ncbi:MAG: ZIP family metal transporter [Flavobacteriales bacterium]